MIETRRCPGVGYYRLRPASGEGMVWVGEVYEVDGVLYCRHDSINRVQREKTGDPILGVPVEKMGSRWLWEPVEITKWR